MWNIVGYKNFFLTASAIIVGLAVIAVIAFGFRQGIEFSGGTLWEFKITNQNTLTTSVIEDYLHNQLGLSDAHVGYDVANNTYLARIPARDGGTSTEADHQKYLAAMRSAYPSFEESSFQSIGPSIGEALKQNALMAIVLVLVAISFYIAYAFRRVSRPISSWKYGWITLLTLFHDIAIPAGLLAILGHYLSVEIDGNFVVALLVVAGFSVHDTIVVFDRIRENLSLDRGKTEFSKLINESVNQSLARSINTSLTLILVLVALYILGPATLHYFILALLVGVITGIYSSIFVASPTLILVSPKAVRAHRKP
jgi:preprotein translocase subunit SecF